MRLPFLTSDPLDLHPRPRLIPLSPFRLVDSQSSQTQFLPLAFEETDFPYPVLGDFVPYFDDHLRLPQSSFVPSFPPLLEVEEEPAEVPGLNPIEEK